MAHGFFYEARQRPDRSSPIFADEIRDTGWDYVALGHQHVLTNVSQGHVTACYPGAPLIHWTGETPNGHIVLLDLSPEHGVRVRPERVF
jgi:DNA repair exonuclease SbcCD nuclease subunit